MTYETIDETGFDRGGSCGGGAGSRVAERTGNGGNGENGENGGNGGNGEPKEQREQSQACLNSAESRLRKTKGQNGENCGGRVGG